ncbi:GNAT family N-acetyltransferase [Streptomyces varsoviensis]|uniref:GCN5 family acetyltransferase n=1 Tax=Streptomyces varsoviensis TaxID=67373 RepID=A0ABR5IUP4_9ACTN|nr:GNAT family N-acetyltransferase [Streptomyces varsoviensis]KOG76107.1 GCN5 family acetyltransferase [Streptomyces varsoviensis]
MTTEHAPPPALTVGGLDAELTDRLNEGLIAYNNAAAGAGDAASLSVRMTDAEGRLAGGLTGWTWGGLFDIELLWVREDFRAGGWGSGILAAAEAEAVRRGCDRAIVSSFTFQAPGFYERQGYTEFGRNGGLPDGHAKVHLRKTLTNGSTDKPTS